MKHRFEDKFWVERAKLPPHIQRRVTRCMEMLRENPPRPSLQLKRINTRWADWAARVDRDYRMAAKDGADDDIFWFWVGPHHKYDKFSRRR